jgi:hypothetical protein
MATRTVREQSAKYSHNTMVNVLEHFVCCMDDQQLRTQYQGAQESLVALRAECDRSASLDAHRHALKWINHFELIEFICEQIAARRNLSLIY